jgi:hypothetical protein
MAMKTKVIVAALWAATLFHWVPFAPAVSLAQTELQPMALPMSTIGFQSGVVDDVQGSSIRIDGRSYVLKAVVLVVTHEGEPLALERIIPTSRVKFHLKEGHVDKMVVTLPQ